MLINQFRGSQRGTDCVVSERSNGRLENLRVEGWSDSREGLTRVMHAGTGSISSNGGEYNLRDLKVVGLYNIQDLDWKDSRRL
jgi:hypothetical protein